MRLRISNRESYAQALYPKWFFYDYILQHFSLIDQFMYPKHGPGQLWEEVADVKVAQGGQILFNKQVVGLHLNEDNIEKIV